MVFFDAFCGGPILHIVGIGNEAYSVIAIPAAFAFIGENVGSEEILFAPGNVDGLVDGPCDGGFELGGLVFGLGWGDVFPAEDSFALENVVAVGFLDWGEATDGWGSVVWWRAGGG